MFSVAPNIVLVRNMTQNAEHKYRMQDTDTAPIWPPYLVIDNDAKEWVYTSSCAHAPM